MRTTGAHKLWLQALPNYINDSVTVNTLICAALRVTIQILSPIALAWPLHDTHNVSRLGACCVGVDLDGSSRTGEGQLTRFG